MKKPRVYVNLGCGSRYDVNWINYDLEPRSHNVIRADLSKGVPLRDSSCDFVYSSAVLEHIRRNQVSQFINECYRVLRPGGYIRVCVPDLERICQIYLQKLEKALGGDKFASEDYDWIVLEALDQMVRERSGGEMLDFLKKDPLINEAFVLSRIGVEGRELLELVRSREKKLNSRLSFRKIPQKLEKIIDIGRRFTACMFLSRHDRQALRIGRFRLSGEVHQWMYDRFSLGRVLIASGFSNPRLFTATTSNLDDWQRYSLDSLPDGSPTKPDLLYMEAEKV